MFRSESTKYLL